MTAMLSLGQVAKLNVIHDSYSGRKFCRIGLQISKKLQITSSMQNRRNFFEKCNTQSVILILLFVLYKENCPFRAEFSTIAYVFVFLIIPYYRGNPSVA